MNVFRSLPLASLAFLTTLGLAHYHAVAAAPLAALARPAAAPTLSSFSPTYGVPGSVITLSGTNLASVTLVEVGSVPGSIISATAISLTFTIPVGATTGLVRVTSPDGVASTSTVLTVVNNSPAQCGLNVPLADVATTDVPIYVSGEAGTLGAGASLTSVDFVTFHSYDRDLVISLISPAGQTVVLSRNNGFSADNYGNPFNCPAEVTHFTDAAATPIGTGAAPFIGSFRPEQPLAGFSTGSPNGVWTLRITDEGGGDTGNLQYVKLNFSAPPADIVVNSSQFVPGGTYRNFTVTGSGSASLNGDVVVEGELKVESGGSLLTNCRALTGPGSFTLEDGAMLLICDQAGISLTGSTGAVQLAGLRSYSPGASYFYVGGIYPGGARQQTGTGLPEEVRRLLISTPLGVGLSRRVNVREELVLNNDLRTNGNALTLLSDAAGTALVVNNGGVVMGDVTVQRAITGGNPGLGYRHYAAPVSSSTVADLAAPGFVPEVSQGAAYNAAAQPGLVTPFPTVFGYNQSRLASSPANLSAFDKGWEAPTALTAPLTVGRGYTVNLPGTAKVDFVGTLNNGDIPLSLTRNAGPTAADAGWQLVGNPYPAPLDWSRVAAADRTGLDAAVYVYESTSQYGGAYRSYVNGIGTGNPLIASGQGFFVRVSDGQTSGTLTFHNSQRVQSFGSQATFRRGPADTRQVVQLSLLDASGHADYASVYWEGAATPGYDSQFDALKLPNPNGLNLASVAAARELAVNGLPLLTGPLSVPLVLQVPAAGTYTFGLPTLQNLPAGTGIYLLDARTGQRLDLRTLPAAGYSFTLTTAEAARPINGRFSLEIDPARGPLASGPGRAQAALTVFPNPAHGTATVQLPAGATGELTLRNTLGQILRRQTASAASTTLDLHGLAPGVYTLRLAAGATVHTQRLVVE